MIRTEKSTKLYDIRKVPGQEGYKPNYINYINDFLNLKK